MDGGAAAEILSTAAGTMQRGHRHDYSCHHHAQISLHMGMCRNKRLKANDVTHQAASSVCCR